LLKNGDKEAPQFINTVIEAPGMPKSTHVAPSARTNTDDVLAPEQVLDVA
jgi:hypothetical protein